MYYMASLASGGFVLTNGCLNHLFQVQVQELVAPHPGPGVVPRPAAGLAPPSLPAVYPGYSSISYPGYIQDDTLLGFISYK